MRDKINEIFYNESLNVIFEKIVTNRALLRLQMILLNCKVVKILNSNWNFDYSYSDFFSLSSKIEWMQISIIKSTLTSHNHSRMNKSYKKIYLLKFRVVSGWIFGCAKKYLNKKESALCVWSLETSSSRNSKKYIMLIYNNNKRKQEVKSVVATWLKKSSNVNHDFLI